MIKRLIILQAAAVLAVAQTNPDVPPPFDGLIPSDQYLLLREQHISLLLGNPTTSAPRDQAIQQLQQQQQAQSLSGAPQATWKPLGPGPVPNGQTQGVTKSVSGRSTAIAIDPADENKVYLGTAQGGVWRSLDGASTWTQIFDNNRTSAIGALTLDAANGRLYVGTGEANGSADSFAGAGLFRIDNVNGAWSQIGPINPVRTYQDNSNNTQNIAVFTGRAISSILIVPNDPTTLFVGTASGVMGEGGDAPLGGTIPPLALRGLYRLTNVTGDPAGVGVVRIGVSTTGPGGCFDTPCTGNRNINSMVFDPSDLTGNTLIVWQNGVNVAGDGGIWRSTNAMTGTPTFTQSFITTATATSNGRGQLVIYQQGGNPAVVYVASGEPSSGTSCTSQASNPGAMRVSTDGGVTFGAKLNGSGGFCGGQCFYNIGVDVLPGPTTAQNDDIIMLGGNVRSTNNCARLGARSTDGGATFIDPSTSGLHADTHFIKFAPSNSNVVYHGDDGGVFKSADGGLTWTSVNPGVNSIQFSGLAVHPTDRNFTIGGSQDNGTNNLATDGVTWNRIDFGDGGYALIDQNAIDTSTVTMYHTYFNQTNNLIGFARVDTVAAAHDGNWPVFGCGGTSNGITCTDAVMFYAPMALGPGSPNILYYGSDRLYRSINKGVNMSLSSQAPLTSGVPISSIAISPQDDNYRLVGLTNGGLFYTTTGSSTMTSLDPTGAGSTIPNVYIGRVMFDPSNKNTAYIGLGGFLGGTNSAQSHIWKVTNLDTAPVISSINSGLPDVPINGIAVDPANGNNVYLGTDIGVYVSTNGGASWAPFGTGLPVASVFDIKIQPTSGVIRIATHGRGMWEAVPVTGTTKVAAIISGKTGSLPGTRTWTIQVSNQGTAPANAIQITGLTLMSTAGPACAPAVISPLPVFVGNIPAAGNASAGVAINFPAGCNSTDRFTVNIGISANNGASTFTTVRNNERP
jgi:hypothetical protein